MQQLGCDIIIPVYNAPDEVKECVDSIIKHTNLDNSRIIIINDCSPDSQVADYLLSINNPAITILHNEVNLGFVGTVNRGMSYSDRDVILLNSDTVVTNQWVEKLIRAAYLEDSIATVTPLTNNGTICSVPKFLEDNEIPEGFTVDSFASFIQAISLQMYPQIPTAVGFCMYIKRKVIDEIGLFDQETFGKGYGEENDFCCRAIEHGYKHIIADDTFIYHKGSMSFKGEKLSLLQKNLDTLNKRYPYYEHNVHEFIVTNSLKQIHENILFRLAYYKDDYKCKGNILYVVHNFFDEEYNHPVGGTEYHVKDLISLLPEYNAYIMVSNTNEIVVKHYFQGQLREKYRFSLANKLTLTRFRDKAFSDILELILNAFNIGLIHIHHLIKHTFDIPYVAKKMNIKVLFTLHDYYLFCPKINLLDDNNQYCIEHRSESKCTACLHNTFGYHTPVITKWKNEVEALIEHVDYFITPSHFTTSLFMNEFKGIGGKIKTIPHGISNSNSRAPQKINIDQKKQAFRVGFLGGLAPNKGSNLIYELITRVKKTKVDWFLIGGLGDQRLNLLEYDNVCKIGSYQREDLDDLLEKLNLDLICLLSPWPETYSYTLSEAWKHEIPVLVTPMGALQERVQKVNGGWISRSTSFDDIYSKFQEIINTSEEEIGKIRSDIRNYKYPTITDMVNSYRLLYSKMYTRNMQINSYDASIFLKSLIYYLPTNMAISPSEYNNQIEMLQKEINLIKSTIGWKVLERIRSKRLPILKIGKKIIFIYLNYIGKYKHVK